MAIRCPRSQTKARPTVHIGLEKNIEDHRNLGDLLIVIRVSANPQITVSPFPATPAPWRTVMKTTAILIVALSLLPAFALATGAIPLTRVDDDGPSQGLVTLDLKELWRAGGEDGEVIFGRISDVVRHSNGEFFVLDNQLCQVEVFSPEGEHLRTLSRQGDGPGEVRQPTGLVLLPGNLLGIGAGFPAKMVTMELDGTPVATRYPIGEPSDGNIGVMISLGTGGGLLAATGGRLVFEGPENSYVERFLAVAEADGEGYTQILKRNTPIDPTGRLWDEAADYYFDGRWDLDPDGLFYVPMKREAYEVSVFDRTGELQFAFGRKFDPRKRTDEDKDQASPIINAAGGRNADEWDICKHDEAITRVMLNPDDGTIWVLTPNGANDQPEGVLETWDIFSPEGEYLKQAAVPNLSDIQDGACFLVGKNLMVVIRGTGSSFNDDRELDEEEAEEEVEPLEIICYEVR